MAFRAFLLVAFAVSAQGARYPAAHEGDFVIRNFRFASGETLPELRLHYRTLGELRRDANGKTNAVLIVHGTGGSGKSFLSDRFAGVLFGAGQPLDATKFFIILPDGIGHGGSSKPSDGLRMKFPRYTYGDMVEAEHRLVTEGLGAGHLRLVMGTSLGAMHTWMWGTRWPEAMDALMPLASAPVQIAGRNRMMRTMLMDSIRNDPEWKGGNYKAQPRGLDGALHMLFMMTSAPLYQQTVAGSRDEADRFIRNYVTNQRKNYDANDMIYMFDASRDYDPSGELEKIRAPLFAVNSADDQVNPPELGILEREIKRVERGRYILLPVSAETRGHGTHSLPAIWEKYLVELLSLSE
jgi:homoserine O-acetyltransferase/O-succinyltransferase